MRDAGVADFPQMEARKWRVLEAVSRAADWTLGLRSMLERVLDTVLETTGLEAGEIRLVENDNLILWTSRGVSSTFVAHEACLPLKRGFCSLAVVNNQPLIADPATCPFDQCEQEGFRSSLSVPLRAGEKPVGLLHVASRKPDALWNELIEELAVSGQIIGTAIEAARLYEQWAALETTSQKALHPEGKASSALQEGQEGQEHALMPRRNRLVRRLLEIQEAERARIAHDLHDSVVQQITGLLYLVRAAQTLLLSQPDQARTLLEEAERTAQLAEKEIRWVIYDLHPVTLAAVGLVPAIIEYVTRYEASTGLKCRVEVLGTPVRLSPPVSFAVYRVVQEALHNAAAHARAREARVTLDFTPPHLRVTVQDDGQGFDLQEVVKRKGPHIGLLGMQERAQAISGHVEIVSSPGQGTQVVITVPLAVDE